MYIQYQRYEPQKATRQIIELADQMLQQFYQDGYILTVRSLYYQLIAQDLLPDSWIDEAYNRKWRLAPKTKNTLKNYKRLVSILTHAREGGLISWKYLVDRGRFLERNSHWDDTANFADEVFPQFAIDRWENQKTRVEVWVEKDAVIQFISRACIPWDVPFFACRGYTSASSIWEAGHHRIMRNYMLHGQNTVILQLSDHDPSGIDMSRDIVERLFMFARPTMDVADQLPKPLPQIEVRRIALTMKQIKQYKLPPNPMKEKDSRSKSYLEEFGNESWELDALKPQILHELIESHIKKIIDMKQFQKDTKRETDWRDHLMSLKPELIKKLRKKK